MQAHTPIGTAEAGEGPKPFPPFPLADFAGYDGQLCCQQLESLSLLG
jgi:hypothetical protein